MDIFDLSAVIRLDSSQMESGLSNAESKFSNFSNKLKSVAKVGAVAVGAVSTAVVGMGTALVKGTGQVASYGDAIDKASQKMGISAQAYQEWDAILQHSGTSVDAMSRGMMTLSKAAENGDESFAKLGISQKEIASMNQEQLFARTIEELQKMESGTERTVLAQKLLGGSAKELGALLNTSAEDTQAMRDRVHELGGVMSDEAVAASAKYQDSLQDMTTALQGTVRGLESEFLPSVTTIMDGMTEIFSGKTEEGLELIQQGVSNLLEKIESMLPQVIQVAGTILSGLGQAILNNLPMIAEKGTQIIMNLISGLISAMPQILSAMGKVITTVASTIAANLPKILQQGIALIVQLAAGIIQAIPQAVAAIPKVISGIVNAFTSFNWLSIGTNIISGIASGIRNAAGSVIDAIGGVASSAINGAKRLLGIASPSKLFRDQIGKMIPAGMALGIENATPLVIDAVEGMSDDAYGAVGDFDYDADTVVKKIDPGDSGRTDGRVADLLQRLIATIEYMDEGLYEKMSDAFSGISLEVNQREFGRLVRDVRV